MYCKRTDAAAQHGDPAFRRVFFCCKTKTTREECEEKLKVLIAEMKKEIAEIKANAKNEG